MQVLTFLSLLVSTLWLARHVPQDPRPLPIEQSKVSVSHIGGSVRVTVRNARLDEIAASLCESANLNILADVPYCPERADFEAQGSLDDVLHAFAERFDLIWRRNGSIVVMRQGFAKRETLPQINVDELKPMVRDVCRVIEMALPGRVDETPPDALVALMQSLTEAQLTVLRSGSPLKCASLSPQQLRLANRLMLCVYLGPAKNEWNQLDFELTHLRRSTFELRDWPDFYFRRNKQPLPKERVGRPPELQMTWAVRYGANGEYSLALPVSSISHSDRAEDALNVKDSPKDESRFAIPADSPSLSTSRDRNREPLDSLVTACLGMTTAEGLVKALRANSGAAITITEGIRNRTLFASFHQVSVKRVLDALVEMEGWNWGKRQNGSIAIERRAAVLPKTITDLPASVQSCLSPELLQFVALGAPVDRFRHIGDAGLRKQIEQHKDEPGYARYSASTLSQEHITAMAKRNNELLTRLRWPKMEEGHALRFTEAPVKFQKALVENLLFRALPSFLRKDANFLAGDLSPLQKDVTNGELRSISGSGISLSYEWSEGGYRRQTGFATGLHSVNEASRQFSRPLR